MYKTKKFIISLLYPQPLLGLRTGVIKDAWGRFEAYKPKISLLCHWFCPLYSTEVFQTFFPCLSLCHCKDGPLYVHTHESPFSESIYRSTIRSWNDESLILFIKAIVPANLNP